VNVFARPQEASMMLDLLFVSLTVGFFVGAFALVAWIERI
jgi:hypothetical protein